ncbi:MAG TPA: hypothetical protein V6C65_22575, partial [Allocoleopsis sp.]
AIDQVGTTLQDLPEKPRENLSLREAVATLQDSITTALDRGYSYEEVVSILSRQRVDITVASLKRYLAAARKQTEDQPKKMRRGGGRTRNVSLEKPAAALTEGVNGNGATAPTPPPEKTEAAPKRRTSSRTSGRTKATEKAPAKASEPAPAPRAKTAAKTKPTSKAAKTTARSTSSRTSRKGKGTAE